MKFRKKPVLVEAYQLPPEDHQTRLAPPTWFISALLDGRVIIVHGTDGSNNPVLSHLNVHTPDGVMRCNVGDWIIQGVKGELYPCKPDVFDATYEPAGR